MISLHIPGSFPWAVCFIPLTSESQLECDIPNLSLRKPYGLAKPKLWSACAEARVRESHPHPATGSTCLWHTASSLPVANGHLPSANLAQKGVSAINSAHLLAQNNHCGLCSVWGMAWVSRAAEKKTKQGWARRSCGRALA